VRANSSHIMARLVFRADLPLPHSDALVAGTPHWREAGEGLAAVALPFLGTLSI